MEVLKLTKAIDTKKQRMQPWSAEEKKNLEYAALQSELELIKKQQSVTILEEGQTDLDEEIEGYIAEAKLDLKKAKLNLKKMEFDKANNLTKKETIFQLQEAKKEVTRLSGNLEFQRKQIEEGKPILQKQAKRVAEPENKPAEAVPDVNTNKAPDDGVPKTQEEANEIAGEDEAKAAQGE